MVRFRLTELPGWSGFCACAFAHFLRYGLMLTERAEYEFRAMDMGNVMHGALERFSGQLKEMGWTGKPSMRIPVML